MRYFITLILSLCGFFGNAQQVQLEGTWKLNIQKTLNKMDEASQQRLNAIPETRREKIKSDFSQRTFIFSSDHNVELEWHDGKELQSQNGTWALNEDELVIQVAGNSQQYQMTLSAVELTLEKVGQSGLFKFLVFSRM